MTTEPTPPASPEQRAAQVLRGGRADVAWEDLAACVDAAFDFTPTTETAHDRIYAQNRWCNHCPVRIDCLAHAMRTRSTGYWAGTDTYQRQQLARVRNRAKCPLCRSTSLVLTDHHEMCIACGGSWVRDVREEPIAATPLPSAAET